MQKVSETITAGFRHFESGLSADGNPFSDNINAKCWDFGYRRASEQKQAMGTVIVMRADKIENVRLDMQVCAMVGYEHYNEDYALDDNPFDGVCKIAWEQGWIRASLAHREESIVEIELIAKDTDNQFALQSIRSVRRRTHLIAV